ncbi:hypothetical protein [Modestobacter sp. SSW1-42]|uniref:hypothetical protein n=1 Tax=Modestobacter sp. SSW1-42 TaxID=596372 RepID=UPI00398774FE
MTAPAPSALPQERRRPTLRDPWTALRVALAVGWLALALTTVLVGQRPGQLEDLRAAVDAGGVTEVRVGEGLEPGATGYATQAVVWRDGLLARRAEGWQVSPGVDAPTTLPVLDTDLAEELRAQGVRVLPLAERSAYSEVAGWQVPQQVGLLLSAAWLVMLFLLVGGPVPQRATRWAWFWLSWNPFGWLALLLLSGPFPGVPAPRPGAGRLTGGWAFLLSLVLGGGLLVPS